MGISRHLRFDHRYFLQGAFWLAALRGLSAGSSFLLALIYAHFLTKEVFGEFKFVLASAGMASALALSGLSNATVPAVARGAEGTVRAAVRLQLRWAWLPFLVGLGFALSELWKQRTTLAMGLLIMAVGVSIYAVFIFYETLLKGRGAYRALAGYGLSQKGLRDISIALAATTFGSLLPLTIAAYVVPTLTAAIIYQVLTRSIPPEKTAVEPQALKYGRTISVFRAFGLALSHVENIVTFYFFGPVALANFGFAKVIPDSLTSLTTLVQPMILNKFSSRTYGAAKNAIYKGMIAFALAGVVGCSVYAIASPYLFKWFFPNYQEMVQLSRLYSVKLVPGGAFLVGLYFHAQQKTRKTLAVGTARILISYSSFIIFFIWRTLEAMVIARVVGEFLAGAVSLIGLHWGEKSPRPPTPGRD